MAGLKKKVSAFHGVTVIGFAMLTIGALAFACTNLATLNLDSSAGGAGQDVTITGSAFGPEEPVTLHWNSAEGEVIAEVTPDATGNISAAVTIPEVQPGAYVIVATQPTAEGGVQFGTPARATFQVTGPGGVIEAPSTATGQLQVSAASSGDSTSAALLAVTVVLGVLGLALFAAGVAGFARQVRRADAPVAVRSDT